MITKYAQKRLNYELLSGIATLQIVQSMSDGQVFYENYTIHCNSKVAYAIFFCDGITEHALKCANMVARSVIAERIGNNTKQPEWLAKSES